MRSIALAALALAAVGVSGHGRLDPSFGEDGQVLASVGNGGGGAHAIALQRDGKLVVAGDGWYYGTGDDFEVARYTRRGEPDRHFSQDGEVSTDFGTNLDQAYAVKIQRDGKIVAAGYSYEASASPAARVEVARYRTNGSLDPSFGTDGKVLEPGYGLALALQRDGKLVVGGQDDSAFALYRLNPNGSLDSGFGRNGEVTTSFGFNSATVFGLAIQSDGKIVAAGEIVNGFGGVTGALARYNPDGSLDPTFGSGGTVTGLGRAFKAIVLQGSHRILAVGGGALYGFRRDGSLDASFGSVAGVAQIPFASRALALQDDGRIVVAGSGPGEDDEDFKLARFTRNGISDPSFRASTDMSRGIDLGYGLVIQRDGKPVIAGVAEWNSVGGGMIGLARYVAPYRCTVPNVKQLPIAAAKRALRLAHCSLGRVTRAASTTVRKGRVISQRPAPGSSRPEHSRVQVVVSSGRR
jgi:uncharacterized delta-60 repeat protein